MRWTCSLGSGRRLCVAAIKMLRLVAKWRAREKRSQSRVSSSSLAPSGNGKTSQLSSEPGDPMTLDNGVRCWGTQCGTRSKLPEATAPVISRKSTYRKPPPSRANSVNIAGDDWSSMKSPKYSERIARSLRGVPLAMMGSYLTLPVAGNPLWVKFRISTTAPPPRVMGNPLPRRAGVELAQLLPEPQEDQNEQKMPDDVVAQCDDTGLRPAHESRAHPRRLSPLGANTS